MTTSVKPITSFEEFLAADSVEFMDVELRPGKIVRIGSITAEDWVAWTELREGGSDGKKASGALLIRKSIVIDDKGTRIGVNDTQAVGLQHMTLKTSELLLKAIFKLNGINQPEVTAAKNA